MTFLVLLFLLLFFGHIPCEADNDTDSVLRTTDSHPPHKQAANAHNVKVLKESHEEIHKPALKDVQPNFKAKTSEPHLGKPEEIRHLPDDKLDIQKPGFDPHLSKLESQDEKTVISSNDAHIHIPEASPEEEGKLASNAIESKDLDPDIAARKSKPCLPTEAPEITTVAGVERLAEVGDILEATQKTVKDSDEASLDSGKDINIVPTENVNEKERGGQKLPPAEHDGEPPADSILQSEEGVETSTDQKFVNEQKTVTGGSAPGKYIDPIQPPVPQALETPTAAPPAENPSPVEGDPQIDSQQEGEQVPEVPPSTDSEHAGKKEDEIPSFDEWKQKMLAEQEEQEKNKLLEAQASEFNTPLSGKIKTSKRSANFASASCGAKVLGTNTEAQNPGFILTENKDQYMINPCKARKWFVVELCEPVQVSSLEMGNLELFSSLPSSFLAQISERYPTKDWKPIGTFHARDERIIQSFVVGDEQIFAKYIRIDIKSHYGTEHYCPLSIIRVFGMTVEEDEADDLDHQQHIEDPDPIDGSESPEQVGGTPPNLFASATDTVLSLVKTVLSHGDKDKEGDMGDVPQEVQNLDADPKANVSTRNSSGEEEEQHKRESLLPCAPDANTHGQNTGGMEPTAPTQPGTPVVDVPFAETPGPASGPPPTTQPPVVTLIETPGSPLSAVLKQCEFCSPLHMSGCEFDMSSTCGYYRIWRFFYPSTCRSDKPPVAPWEPNSPDKLAVDIPGKAPPKTEDVVESDNHEVTPDNTLHVKVDELNTASDSEENGSSAEKTPDIQIIVPSDVHESSSSVVEAEQSLAVSNSSEIGGATVDDVIKPSQTITSSEIDANVIQRTEVLPTTTPNSVSVQQSSQSCDATTEGEDYCMHGPDVVQIRPTATIHVTSSGDALANDKAAPKEEDSNIEPSESGSQDAPQEQELQSVGDKGSESGVTAADKVEADGGRENGLKNIYADEPKDVDLKLEHVTPPSEEVIFQKIASNTRKETTYMKLKNKIKNLELNLNLSSRYLEELSQRYKKKMEDMYVSLNNTIAKLANTSKSAEERDMKQQERIAHLENQVENISSIVQTVREDLLAVHSQVIERHLFLMLLEAVIFICMLAWCVARQQNMEQKNKIQQNTQKLSTIPKTLKEKPPDVDRTVMQKGSKKKVPIRRNSMDTTPRRGHSLSLVPTPQRTSYDDTDLYKGRDTDLTIIEPNIPIFITDIKPSSRPLEVTNAQKKKKKKKDKQQKMAAARPTLNHTSHNNSAKIVDSTHAEAISGVQDVPMTSSLSSTHSSSQTSLSSISSVGSSHLHRESSAPVLSAKHVQHSKHAARKSLDSAFSSVKCHKYSRSNGSAANVVGVNGHSGGVAGGDACETSALRVNGSAGQPMNGVNGSSFGTSSKRDIKGWFPPKD